MRGVVLLDALFGLLALAVPALAEAQVVAHIPLDPNWLWFNPLPGRYVFADKVFCCARTCHGCSLTAELPNGTCPAPLFQRQGSCHRQACHALQLTFFSDPTWETAIIGGLS